MTEIVMPKLSDTMSEGTFGAWLKAVGDQVTKGDILAEVETDKATMELEAFSSGILLEQRVTPGQTVAVGTVIGLIGEPGERPINKPPTETSPPPGTGPDVPPSSSDTPERSSAGPDTATGTPSVPVDIPASSPMPAESRSHPLSGPAPQGEEGHPISRMRAAIARTVGESWQTIPHFSVTTDIRMERAEEMRRELKQNKLPVSLNDIFVKAASLALQQYPQLNASFLNNAIVFHQEINIGIMVGVPGGLLVPVIKGCQSLSLRQIAEMSRQLIERARTNTISEPELRDATFSLSNLGMYGVSHFSALILPPQVAILAIGAVQDAVTMERGVPTAKRVLMATLSADHRALDGICAAEFLNALKHALENPLQLLLR